MKILLIIFCFTSIKSTFCVNGVASPQWLNYSRRRLLMPNQYQRANPNLAKLIFLKRLLETDSFRNIYMKNCHIGHQFPKHQKIPSTTRLNAMPAFRNNGIYPAANDGVKKTYFVNPKIINLPALTSTKETTGNNFQNHKGLDYKKIPPQYMRTVSEDGEKTKTMEAKNEESLRKENHSSLDKAKNFVIKNSILEEIRTVPSGDGNVPGLPAHTNPIEPSSTTYPETIPNLLNLLKSGPTQIYEVEEIIEGTVNVHKENFKKLRVGERTYFENNVKSIPNDNQDQKVLDKNVKTIPKGMNELVTSSPSTESLLSEVFADASIKVPVVQPTAPTQFQQFFRVLPSGATNVVTKKTVSPVKTIPTDEEYSIRRTQNPYLFPFEKPNNREGALNPQDKVHKIFEITPSVTTNALRHADSGEENAEKIETKGFETAPHTFFDFFNKESSENPGHKLEIIPEKKNWNSFTLPSIPSRQFENIPDGQLQALLKNLVTNDLKQEMIKKGSPNPTIQSFLQTFTVSVQTNNVTLVPFDGALSTQLPSTFEPDNHILADVNTTTQRSAQDRNDVPFTTSSSIVLNLDSTTSNLKKSSIGSISINLLSSTNKSELNKDQEPNGKNSRKMHFNQDIQKETAFNQITESSDTDPRRSDILITDYTDEYKENENHFFNLSYLDRIKPNDTISMNDFLSDIKIDSYIPLIPEIINDIRENKISDQDLSLLSDVFGKYWSNILAMSNNTELDVLPLLTMKSEKDLISFMVDHFPDAYKTSTAETDELKIDGKDSLKHAYDYEGAYEELYDYVLGQEVTAKKKRYRHKRNDELEYQKLEANKEYFESLKEEGTNGKIEYMFEYVMYDDTLDDENVPVLELIRPADFYVNIKNETSQGE